MQIASFLPSTTPGACYALRYVSHTFLKLSLHRLLIAAETATPDFPMWQLCTKQTENWWPMAFSVMAQDVSLHATLPPTTVQQSRPDYKTWFPSGSVSSAALCFEWWRRMVCKEFQPFMLVTQATTSADTGSQLLATRIVIILYHLNATVSTAWCSLLPVMLVVRAGCRNITSNNSYVCAAGYWPMAYILILGRKYFLLLVTTGAAASIRSSLAVLKWGGSSPWRKVNVYVAGWSPGVFLDGPTKLGCSEMVKPESGGEAQRNACQYTVNVLTRQTRSKVIEPSWMLRCVNILLPCLRVLWVG